MLFLHASNVTYDGHQKRGHLRSYSLSLETGICLTRTHPRKASTRSLGIQTLSNRFGGPTTHYAQRPFAYLRRWFRNRGVVVGQKTDSRRPPPPKLLPPRSPLSLVDVPHSFLVVTGLATGTPRRLHTGPRPSKRRYGAVLRPSRPELYLASTHANTNLHPFPP